MSNSLLGFCVQVRFVLTSGVKRREVSICILFLIVIVKLSPWILRTSQLILASGVKRRESSCTKSLVFFGKSSDFHAIFFSDLCYILWNPLNLHYYLSFFWSFYSLVCVQERSQREGSLLCIYLFETNWYCLLHSYTLFTLFNW